MFRKSHLIRRLVLLTVFVAANVYGQPALDIGIVAPDTEKSQLWRDTVEFMRVVAGSLDINLQASYAKSNDISFKRTAEQMLNSNNRPDYFLIGHWNTFTYRIALDAIEKNTKVLGFNSGFSESELAAINNASGEEKLWLGELEPENKAAGYRLADTLLSARKKTTGKQRILAISAYAEDPVSSERVNGLQQRISNTQDAELVEIVLAGWQRENAKQLTLRALEKYKTIDVIWAVSDLMALGAIDAIEKKGLQPGVDIVVGGFDWDKDNVELMRLGKITASMGGQIFDGGWALILLYDYHHGIDFTGPANAGRNLSLQELNRGNVDEYIANVQNIDWNTIDFKKFSKKHNPELREYDFSIKALLNAKD